MDQPAARRQDLLVFQTHAPRAARRQAEIEAECLPAGVLQQRGIVVLDHAGVEGGVRLGWLLAGGLLQQPVQPGLEAREHGLGRHGEDVLSRDRDVVGIVEFLLHAGDGVEVIDGDGDVVIADDQVAGSEALGVGQDHAVGVGEGGEQAGQEGCQQQNQACLSHGDSPFDWRGTGAR